MFKKLYSKNKLYCFTPEVMLATFIIEGILALYVWFRYKTTKFAKASVLLIIFLGLVQVSEYQICAGQSNSFWLKIGFISMTALPVLGLYLTSLVKEKSKFLELGYFLAGVFIIYFIFFIPTIKSICAGNYVIFEGNKILRDFYSPYYFIFLFLSVSDLLGKALKTKEQEEKKFIYWFIFGYFSFLFPMGVVYILFEQTRNAVPSIMCGFAVILAFVTAFKVVPKYNKLFVKDK